MNNREHFCNVVVWGVFIGLPCVVYQTNEYQIPNTLFLYRFIDLGKLQKYAKKWLHVLIGINENIFRGVKLHYDGLMKTNFFKLNKVSEDESYQLLIMEIIQSRLTFEVQG